MLSVRPAFKWKGELGRQKLELHTSVVDLPGKRHGEGIDMETEAEKAVNQSDQAAENLSEHPKPARHDHLKTGQA